MKSFFLSAASVAFLLALYAVADVHAQRSASGPATAIGIVDISYIFKNHRGFQQQMEDMKQAAETTKNELTKERDKINRQIEKLKGSSATKGTKEYKQLEEDITHMQADFNAKTTIQEKVFLERESQIYVNVYREVSEAVSQHARRRGMTMVLRFNGDPVEAGNRDSVLRDINKPIVYYTRDADITPDVLDDLNGPGTKTGGNIPRPADNRGGVRPPATR